MGQAYRIDRINLITYPGNRKKILQSCRCRYLAKSHIVNCSAKGQTFDFVNFATVLSQILISTTQQS